MYVDLYLVYFNCAMEFCFMNMLIYLSIIILIGRKLPPLFLFSK